MVSTISKTQDRIIDAFPINDDKIVVKLRSGSSFYIGQARLVQTAPDTQIFNPRIFDARRLSVVSTMSRDGIITDFVMAYEGPSLRYHSFSIHKRGSVNEPTIINPLKKGYLAAHVEGYRDMVSIDLTTNERREALAFLVELLDGDKALDYAVAYDLWMETPHVSTAGDDDAYGYAMAFGAVWQLVATIIANLGEAE